MIATQLNDKGELIQIQMDLDWLHAQLDQLENTYKKGMGQMDKLRRKTLSKWFFELGLILTYLRSVDSGVDLADDLVAHPKGVPEDLEILYDDDEIPKKQMEEILDDPQSQLVLQNMFLIGGVNPVVISKRLRVQNQ